MSKQRYVLIAFVLVTSLIARARDLRATECRPCPSSCALEVLEQTLRRRPEQHCIDAGDGTDNDLAVQAHEIMTCIQSEQGLRNVESRIVDLQHRLQQHYDDTSQGAISPQNARMMVDNYERLRRDVRGLPHY